MSEKMEAKLMPRTQADVVEWRKEHLRACDKQTGNIKIYGMTLVPGFEEQWYSTINLNKKSPDYSTVRITCKACGEDVVMRVKD